MVPGAAVLAADALLEVGLYIVGLLLGRLGKLADGLFRERLSQLGKTGSARVHLTKYIADRFGFYLRFSVHRLLPAAFSAARASLEKRSSALHWRICSADLRSHSSRSGSRLFRWSIAC